MLLYTLLSVFQVVDKAHQNLQLKKKIILNFEKKVNKKIKEKI
jgi:hypothetical protein